MKFFSALFLTTILAGSVGLTRPAQAQAGKLVWLQLEKVIALIGKGSEADAKSALYETASMCANLPAKEQFATNLVRGTLEAELGNKAAAELAERLAIKSIDPAASVSANTGLLPATEAKCVGLLKQTANSAIASRVLFSCYRLQKKSEKPNRSQRVFLGLMDKSFEESLKEKLDYLDKHPYPAKKH